MTTRRRLYMHPTALNRCGRLFPFALPSRPGRVILAKRNRHGRIIR